MMFLRNLHPRYNKHIRRNFKLQKIDLKNKTILVTGSAGFIGNNLILSLLRAQAPINIIGLDNMNDYYDVRIKEWRLSKIDKYVTEHPNCKYNFLQR